MAVKSLPSMGKKPAASTSKLPAADSPLTRISKLAALLPPAAPASASLNPLADLVQLYESRALQLAADATPKEREANRQEVHTALHALKAIFEALIKQGRLHGILKSAKRVRVDTAEGRKEQAKEDASVQKVKAWLKERWDDYLAQTARVVGGHWDGSVRLSALNALMSLVRTESLFLTSLHSERQAKFAHGTFANVVRSLLLPPSEDGTLPSDVAEEWLKWWDRCDDVRYWFLRETASLLSTYSRSAASLAPPPLPDQLIPNAISILESLSTMPTASSELNEWFCATPTIKAAPAASSKKRKAEDERPDGSTGIFDSSSESESEPEIIKQLNSQQRKKNLPALLSLVAHRRAFQDCWLAILALPIKEQDSKRVLIMLHRQVLPHMTEPRRLMDWLVDCSDVGGTVGILALNGLFTLMQKHGLEFPDFYQKLYSLLDRNVLHVRYRPRFFRLLDIFMSSSHLPATLVASFIKRLARLSLAASPAAIVTVVPFIYNLLKRHPSCMPLIHRVSEGQDEYDWSKDPFNADEPSPTETGALDSSLWEIAALQQHYLASVSGLAKVFSEVMNKQSYTMEDFLDHSYATLIETELARKIVKRAPALAPVPQRQPIGDSFFPDPSTGGRAVAAEVKKVKAVVADGEDAADDEEDEPVDLGPVDVVSRLWSF
ncbi:hypothetical protein Rhopal_001998-T1 [Rhodotorula paludigena]|uniref:CCAAT-binding factor domain-containing protein n=1 Tax=Rhodotorula paludigena TaxID=86838 RepID=A0AAV5GGN7_9BASI|nr:hypothetical protein Rhopal_001998-T1 [Rhodotorula paludigena]